MKYTFSDDDNDYDTSDAQPYARRSLRNAAASADPAKPIVTTSGRQSKPSTFLYGEPALAEQQGVDANMTDAYSHALGEEYGDDAGYENDKTAAVLHGNRPVRPSKGTEGDQWASSKGVGQGHHIQGYNSVDEMDDEDEAEASSSGRDDDRDGGDEWDGGEDEYDDAANGRDESNEDEDEDEQMSEDEEDQLDGIGGDGDGRVDRRKIKEKQSLVVQLRYGKRSENGGVDGGEGAEGASPNGNPSNIRQDIAMNTQRNKNGDGGVSSLSHSTDANPSTFVDHDEQYGIYSKQPKLEAEKEEEEESNTIRHLSQNNMTKENLSIPFLPHSQPCSQLPVPAPAPVPPSTLSASASASSPPSHLPPPPPSAEPSSSA